MRRLVTVILIALVSAAAALAWLYEGEPERAGEIAQAAWEAHGP